MPEILKALLEEGVLGLMLALSVGANVWQYKNAQAVLKLLAEAYKRGAEESRILDRIFLILDERLEK